MEAILRKEVILNKALCRTFLVVAFIILTAFGAFVRVPLPFTPVPITLQTFFVLLSAALLGSGLGAFTQLSYIAMGAAGMPIFTGAGFGSSYLLGPTGGYLFGFVLATLWLGKFIRYNNDNLLLTFIIFCTADLILLASGIIWLKFIFGYTFAKIFFIGFFPFVAVDLAKAFVASVIYLKLKSRLREVL
jgi:biotin transport system substrate-specific component